MLSLPPNRNLGAAEAWGKWVEGNLGDIDQTVIEQSQARQRSEKGLNASLTQLANQIQRLNEQNTSFVTDQTLPYDGPGTSVDVAAPSWANYALISAAMIGTETTANGPGRITLMHGSNPITSYYEYNGSAQYSYGPTVADFVGQRYPSIVPVFGGGTLYTRPWAVPMGATSGTLSVTFVVGVVWIP